MLNTATCVLMATLAVGADSAARQPPAAATPSAVIEHCQVFLIKDIQISANEAGALLSLDVRDGDHVQAGELLGRIDDRQAQYDKLAAELKRNVALTRSQDDIEVRFARAAFEVADAELTQSMEANRHTANAVPTVEIRRLKLTRKKAELEIDRSQLQMRIAGMTADVETTAVAAAEESIRRRQIMAPFAGMVLEVLRDQAEWVNAGEPVLRMIQLDRLRVEGFLNVRQLNPEEVDGRPVTVTVQRAHGQRVQLPGQVVFVSPMIQAGDTYRIRAEVENQLLDSHWVLRPGMTANMTIHVAQ